MQTIDFKNKTFKYLKNLALVGLQAPNDLLDVWNEIGITVSSKTFLPQTSQGFAKHQENIHLLSRYWQNMELIISTISNIIIVAKIIIIFPWSDNHLSMIIML